MKKVINSLIKEISQCNTKEFIITLFAGILAILWPLGGVLLYFISKKTQFKLYGKIALYCAALAMMAYIFKLIVMLLF